MLSFFRKGGTGQVVIGAVVFAVIIVFVMEFRPGRQGSSSFSRNCAVTVLDSCVDRKEFFAAFGLTVPREVPQKSVKEMGLRKAVIDGLIERELLLKEADRLGISISLEETDKELAEGRARVSLPSAQASFLSYQLRLTEDWVRLLPVKSQQTKEFDYAIYERVVRNMTNRSPKEFKEMQQREIIAQRMRDLVKSRVRIADNEAYTVWERDKNTARARVAEVKRDWFGKWVVDPSDAAVDDWAAKNTKQVDETWKLAQAGWKADCTLASEIIVPVEPESGDDSKKERRQKAEDALAKIKKGSTFENVAREFSEGAAAAWGGDLGCLNEDYGPGGKELLDAMAKMKTGEVSVVLETPRGFHVVKLNGKLAKEQVEKVGKRSVARRLAIPAMATDLSKEFADKVIEEAKKGTPLEQTVNTLAAEYAKRRAPAAKKPVMAPGVEAPKAPAKKPEDPPALSDPLKPHVITTAELNIASAVVEDALPTEIATVKLFELEKTDSLVAKPVATRSGFAVIQLKEKTKAKKADFDKDRLVIMRTLRAAKEDDAVQRYIASLRNQAKDKISFDQSLLEEPKDDGSGDG
jgi:peptidyl-prolyl cis-trans isomerase D